MCSGCTSVFGARGKEDLREQQERLAAVDVGQRGEQLKGRQPEVIRAI